MAADAGRDGGSLAPVIFYNRFPIGHGGTAIEAKKSAEILCKQIALHGIALSSIG
jgi:hypothetical protein